MIPATTIAKLATLGLSASQVAAVAEMMAEVEAATEAKAATGIASRRESERARTARHRARGSDQICEELRQAVYERDGFACVYCGSEDHIQCDHVVALTQEGPTSLDNLATTCRVCSARKKDRDRKYVQRHSTDIPRTFRGNPRTSVDPLPLSSSPPHPPNNYPPSPGCAAPRARARGDLEADLRKAADLVDSPSPTLFDLSPILGLIDAGFDLVQEILPVIRAKRNPRARSWSYFVEAIQEAKARRSAVAGSPSLVVDNRWPSQRAPPGGPRNPHLAALDDHFATLHREVP